MGEIFGELLPAIQLLLPGFISTVVFYWLSDAPKPGQFERVIQALICTGLISLLVEAIKKAGLAIGDCCFVWAAWTDDRAMALSVALAVLLGLALAFAACTDSFYKLARRCRLTTRASHTDWVYGFVLYRERLVVLQLQDGRRICGYPLVWPTQPGTGHFLLQGACWIVDGQFKASEGVAAHLIGGSEVSWVEFLNPIEEGQVTDDGQNEARADGAARDKRRVECEPS
ncbi:DUF6338 family protein [Maricaulis maris]|uniref:DUF6338 family protein n=1 Tax=Maricaulis maris TaxID=74318 RepID=UPI003A925C27